MNNKQKRDLFGFLSILFGIPLGGGIVSLCYMWYQSTQQMDAILFSKTILPYWPIAMVLVAGFNICFNQYRKYNTGIVGEEKTQAVLSSLPSNYHCFYNVPVSYGDKLSELDNLIISKNGIVIVETKNYAGRVYGNENDPFWNQTKVSAKGYTYENQIKNPVKQMKRQVYILSKILKDHDISCRIKGYVYMANHNCSTNSDLVFTNKNDLLYTIKSTQSKYPLTEQEIRQIYHVLGL